MPNGKEIFDNFSQAKPQIIRVWFDLISQRLPPENLFLQLSDQRALFYLDLHLYYIVCASALSDPTFYLNYVSWVKRMIEARNHPLSFVNINFECIKDAFKLTLPPHIFTLFEPLLIEGEKRLIQNTSPIPEFYYQKPGDQQIARKYLELIVNGKKSDVIMFVEDLIKNKMTLSELYQEIITPSQYEIGRLWEMNQISVAQEHLATAISQYLMGTLFSRIPLNLPRKHPCPRIIGVCVGSELHELGLRMLMDLFELHGWDTIFLGANTPVKDLMQMLKTDPVDVLAISVTMISHLPDLLELIPLVKTLGEKRPRIIVGGYPFNQNRILWQFADADGYAANFEAALSITTNWVNKGGTKKK